MKSGKANVRAQTGKSGNGTHGKLWTTTLENRFAEAESRLGSTRKRLIQELIVNEKVDVFGGGLTANLLPSASLLPARMASTSR